MKIWLMYLVVACLGWVAAEPAHAQYRPATATVAKHTQAKPPVTLRGSIGGPNRKVGGIGGTPSKSGGINGTIRPRY